MASNTEKAVDELDVSVQSEHDVIEQNDGANLVYRNERKYAISDVDIHAVENYVRSHPALFTQPFPARYVNNIYFDTIRYQDYSENLIGAMNRNKYRIRWYGQQFGHIENPVLEIKIKKGVTGAKKLFPLVPFTLDETFSSKKIDVIINKSVIPDQIKETLRHYSPSLLNLYYRKYFLSADRRFRLTLDSQISYTRITKYQNYFLRKVSDISNVIMELKYEIKYDTEFNLISNHFPFRMTKNSKYVNGIDHLDLW